MSAKYFYMYAIVGVIFLSIAIYDLVKRNFHFDGTVLDDLLAAIAFFYISYKAYKKKRDQELM